MDLLLKAYEATHSLTCLFSLSQLISLEPMLHPKYYASFSPVDDGICCEAYQTLNM
jgi:hypothetical protein